MDWTVRFNVKKMNIPLKFIQRCNKMLENFAKKKRVWQADCKVHTKSKNIQNDQKQLKRRIQLEGLDYQILRHTIKLQNSRKDDFGITNTQININEWSPEIDLDFC